MIAGDPLGIGAVAAELRRRLDWREEALTGSLIVAESAIVYLALGVLLPESSAPYAPFPGWLIFGLMAVAYYVPHLLDELRVWNPRYETVLTVTVVLSLLVAFKVGAFPHDAWLSTSWPRGTVAALIVRPSPAVRPPWAIVGVVAYAWWRGRTRAEPMLETAYQMLRWGTLATTIALLLILMAAPLGGLIRSTMAGAVVLYFAGALAAIGLARLRLEGVRSGSPLGPHWLATFAVPIVAVVLLAVVAAGIFSRSFLDTMLVVLGPLLWLVGEAIRALVILVALIAFLIIAPILWLLERQGLNRFPLTGQLPHAISPFAQLDHLAHSSLHIADPIRYLVAGAVISLIVSALARYAFRRRRRWRDEVAEQRESVFAWDEAVGGLAGPVRRLLGLRRPPRDSLEQLRRDPRWAHTVAIRETYRQLLHRGARAGTPLAPGATPDEHERALAGRFPGSGAEIADLTAVYDAARYGAEPAPAEAAERARVAWSTFDRRQG
ncbi:MAG TPA: DUF4129 domain-containing protein [Thermomicrobiaceae bacterium]|nr:DUF4129 domain-containing protein [Thermomicrobiaceae bacterium]